MNWVALVGPEVEENLGLRYLTAALQAKGFDVEIVPYDTRHDFPRVLEALTGLDEPPLLVGLSLAFQWRALDCLALAMALREKGYGGHITAGGHFSGFTFLELLRDFPELDSICLYEAEDTVVRLARALQDGTSLADLAGLARRGPDGEVVSTPPSAVTDLTTLRHPDRRGEPTRCLGHGMCPLVASRGCYARCSFCCIAAWHARAMEGKRFRLRPVDDVADEMAGLYHRRGIEIFIFHDDNFFVPSRRRSLERIHALADALDARGVGRIATVIKSRPSDVETELFEAMQRRLGCVRVFLGVETDADQGLQTLQRRVSREQNHAAMEVFRALDLYVCFNLLAFDPDTTLDSLRANLDFMERYGDAASNFGRVELYAGTPLLARMKAEGRHRGDYLAGEYRMATPEVQRVFELFMRCFFPRNFSGTAMANRLMGTRFDAEICRHFHHDVFRPEYLERARGFNGRLAEDSAAGMREIIGFVEEAGPDADAREVVRDLHSRLRATEARLEREAILLEETLQRAVGARCQHSLEHAGWARRATP